MRSFTCALLLLSIVATALAQEEAVLSLGDADFHETVNDLELALVEFYAPWCGHCKRLEPEYEAAAQILKDEGVALIKVDATENEDLAMEYQIEGFPTLKVFRNGQESEYKGGRSSDDIVSYMRKQNGPAVRDVSDQETLDQLKESNEVLFVGCFASENADFSKVASNLRDNFIFVRLASSLYSANGGAEGKVIVFKQFDEGSATLDKVDEESLTAFIGQHSLPLCGEIGPENFEKFLERELPFMWIFVDMEDEAQFSKITTECSDVAKGYTDKLLFVYLDGNKYGEQATGLGLSGTKIPALALNDEEHHFAHSEEGTIDAAAMKQFADDYFAGKLVPSIQSEEVPEDNDGPVRVIVGKTFEEEVVKTDKDVLIEFYAPWCGHCKSLAPVYEEVGQAVKDTEGLVIAKIDATANEFPPDFDVQGFPTIKFVKAGDVENMIDFDGDRSFEGIMEFLAEHSNHKFSYVNVGGLQRSVNGLGGIANQVNSLIEKYEEAQKEISDLKAEIATLKGESSGSSHDEL